MRVRSFLPFLSVPLLLLHACAGKVAELPAPTPQDGADGAAIDTGLTVDAAALPDVAAQLDVAVGPVVIDASDRLDWMKQAIVGTWQGMRTDPWDAPAEVQIHFDASGSYTAHCLAYMAPGVWHYGTDDDLPGKTYSLFDLSADMSGEAHIAITFSDAEATEGTLESITIDPSALSLSFDFFPTWIGNYGPVHFDLQRVD